MPNDLSLAEAREILRSRERLLERNVAARQLRASSNGAWERVHRGVYAAHDVVSDLRPAARHRLDTVAVVSRMRGGGAVVSHISAAVLHGPPLYRFRAQPVELTLPPGRRGASRPGIRRYRDHLDEDDVVELDGIRCTSLERTVFDVARTRGLESSVSCADAGLRCVAGVGHGVDAAQQEAWRERMRERARRAKGRRGVTTARWVAEFADGRAELPGESVSRLQLFRLGFRDLDVQVPVAAPADSTYFVDIGLTEVETFWEFDGEGKYRDPALRSGKSIDDVMLAEKRREDWIRGTTGWRVCRGGFLDIATPEMLAARLRSFGVRLPG